MKNHKNLLSYENWSEKVKKLRDGNTSSARHILNFDLDILNTLK